jgi:hypothetical protein
MYRFDHHPVVCISKDKSEVSVAYVNPDFLCDKNHNNHPPAGGSAFYKSFLPSRSKSALRQ